MQSETCTSSVLAFRIADSDEQLEFSEHCPLTKFSGVIFDNISKQDVSIEHKGKYYAVSIDSLRKTIIITNAPDAEETVSKKIQETLQIFFTKYTAVEKKLDEDEFHTTSIGDFLLTNATS